MRELQITEAKKTRGMVSFIVETDNSREFFRYVNGELEEYDLTKKNGKQIRLTMTEQEVMKQWDISGDFSVE